MTSEPIRLKPGDRRGPQLVRNHQGLWMITGWHIDGGRWERRAAELEIALFQELDRLRRRLKAAQKRIRQLLGEAQ